MDSGTRCPHRCASTAPDLWTVQCELAAGHDGPHRNNMVTWAEPLIVSVGGQPADATINSRHWIDGVVVLTDDEPPV